VVIGLVLGFGGIRFPYVIEKPLQDLGNMAPPLALLCIGSSLDTSMVKRSFRYAFIAASVKTWGMAAVALPVAVMLGFRGFDLTSSPFSAPQPTPTATMSWRLATDSDSDLAASPSFLSTLMSSFHMSPSRPSGISA
jgi:predicted permease